MWHAGSTRWYPSLACVLQLDGDDADKSHIEIPPEVFCLVRKDSGSGGPRKLGQWREGFVPNAASGIELHFPSHCRPKDQLAVRMEKLQKHSGQLGADCSTDRAAVLEGVIVYGAA